MAINLLSPINRMPFGNEKGTPIWNLSINTVNWLRKQNLTEDAKEILDDAWQMFLNEGSYAILSRDAFKVGKVRLVLLCRDYNLAKLACTHVNEFVYYISTRRSLEKAC